MPYILRYFLLLEIRGQLSFGTSKATTAALYSIRAEIRCSGFGTRRAKDEA